MRWQGRGRSSNVQDRRGMGTGGKMAGGGLGFIAIAIVVALLGGDPSALFQEGLNRTIGTQISPQSRFSETEQQEMVDFVSVVLAETEDTWGRYFAAQNAQYPQPSMIIFSGGVDSGCGFAQSAVGPFYCPLDQNLYIDLDFFYDLKNRHDAPGDFAQAYVIAHEVGHHIQNITGVSTEVRKEQQKKPNDANDLSVRLELQADCLAGIWGHSANAKGDLLEPGDLEEGINAAGAVGDDRIQSQSGGRVDPDSFTHGTGEQRIKWFRKGYETGDPTACDTFEGDV
jgi:predicted metalloprotease